MIALGFSGPLGPVRYRLFRRLIRMGVALIYGRIRFLGAERLPATGAALLAINYPSGLIGPLMLVAALERRVRCFVSRQSFRGTWGKLLAWGLGLVPYDSESKAVRHGTGHGSEMLAGGDVVALFPEADSAPASAAREFFGRAASLALAAEALRAGQGGLAVLPVHLFLPGKPLNSKETLLYVERPLDLKRLFQEARSMAERTRALFEALGEASRRNVFRLQPNDLTFLLAGLEEVLRADLEEEWRARPNWKQKADGFGLSGYVKNWAEQMNLFEPARLVALRELLLDYRERRRSVSLRRLKVDTAGRWVNSLWLRLRGPHDARSLVRSRKLLVRELVAGRDVSLEALRLST
jgi:1-acyl-sn-glycerol-3-phosphate acyltransferase